LEKLRKITLADGHILITEMIKKAKKNYSGTKIVRLNFLEVRFAWFISQDKLIFT